MKTKIGKKLLSLLLSVALVLTMLPAAIAVDADGATAGQNIVLQGDSLTGEEDEETEDKEEGGETEDKEENGETEDDEEETQPPAAAATVKNVVLRPTQSTLKVGESVTLTLEITMSDGTVYSDENPLPSDSDITIEWKEVPWTGESTRLQISQTTDFRAQATAEKLAETNEHKETFVQVTVKQKGISVGNPVSCEITVEANEPAGVFITPASVEVAPGSTTILKATVTPSTASQEVSWASKDTSIATVDENGKVTGVSAGKTQISATSATTVAYCDVTVQGIILDDHSVTMKERGTYTLNYEIFGAQLSSKSVEWTSSEPSIVRVTNGYLYGLQEGEAVITAKVSGATYTDSCTVKVERNTAAVISASASTASPFSFSEIASDFEDRCETVLGQSLSYISGLSVSTSQGTLYYKYYSEADTGAGIGTAERYYVDPSTGQMDLDDVTFVPKDDFSGTATISYTGYADGTQFFQGTIEVKVAEQKDVEYAVMGDKPVQFSAEDFMRICRSRTGRDLSYVMFSQPDSGRGTLYYHYISEQNYGTEVESSKKYQYSGTPSLDDVFFIPSSGFSGEVVVPYTACDVNGDTFRGHVTIEVGKSSGRGDINYSIAKGSRVTMDEDDFNDLSRELTGYSLDYVDFSLPDSSKGTLYYNYTSSGSYDSKVSESRHYYRNSSPYLRRVTFVADDDYSGTVSFDFTGWDTKGNRFYGTVEIQVGYSDSDAIRYSTYSGGYIRFDDSDFNEVCQDLTNTNVRYVRFELPSSSEGMLYYNYTSSTGDYDSKVEESRSYYRNDYPYIDRITFVADEDFTGTVSIPFRGWGTGGDEFQGVVEIGVDSSGTNHITYDVGYGDWVTFRDEDFNDFCEYRTGDDLRYVRFTLPSTSRGTLYYGYDDDGDYDSKVTSGRSYYISTSPYLDRVSFVPNDNYSGTVEIDFNGVNVNGRSFSGTVRINVGEPAPASAITYSTSYAPITLRTQDFILACADRGMGSLSYIRFDSIEGNGGRLYYQYAGLKSANIEARTGVNYYTDKAPRIAELTFLPKAGYSGGVTLNYTGTDSRGKSYTGTVRISIQPSTYSQYFHDMWNTTWAASSVDLLYENGIVNGTEQGVYSPELPISRGSFLYMIDQALELPAANSPGFYDVPQDSYYAQAISKAYALGITSGYPDGSFRPDEPLSRQDAMVILYRALQTAGWSLGTSGTGVLNSYRDGAAVASYARDAMATMISYGLLSGNTDNTLTPNGNMTRAEMAVVLARVLTM